MRLSDEQLRTLVVAGDAAARRELAQRVKWQALRAMPNPVGECSHGRFVYADNRGAMSSGYICHKGDHSICDGEVEWGDPSPQRKMREIVEWCNSLCEQITLDKRSRRL